MADFPVRSDVLNLEKGILRVTNLFHEFGVDVWLNYGALLGVVRQGSLLPWNNDAELCCRYYVGIEEVFDRVLGALASEGYFCTHYPVIGAMSIHGEGCVINVNCVIRSGELATRPHEPCAQGREGFISQFFYWLLMLSLSKSRARNLKALFFFSKFKFLKYLVSYIFSLVPTILLERIHRLGMRVLKRAGFTIGITAVPFEFYENFKRIEFGTGSVLIPEDAEKLLKFIYGDGWRVPKDNWSFYSKENMNESSVFFLDELWDYAYQEYEIT